MMSLTFGLFTQVSGSGPLGPLVINGLGGHLEFRIMTVVFISYNQYMNAKYGILS